MSAGEWLLVVLLTGIGGGSGGYVYGHAAGAAGKVAEQDRETVKGLTEIITSHADLITKASAASKSMRQAIALRSQADTQSTTELKDALAATADSRSGCTFDAGVMRQLATARDRAAQAAAGGVLGAVPSASNGSERP